MTASNENDKKDLKKQPKKPTNGSSIWMQLVIAFGVFLLLSGGYSLVRDYVANSNKEVAISQSASDITAGKITSIIVAGDQVEATYTDTSIKTSHKESETSFTDTLNNYGITADKLAGVKVEIQDQSGPRY